MLPPQIAPSPPPRKLITYNPHLNPRASICTLYPYRHNAKPNDPPRAAPSGTGTAVRASPLGFHRAYVALYFHFWRWQWLACAQMNGRVRERVSGWCCLRLRGLPLLWIMAVCHIFIYYGGKRRKKERMRLWRYGWGFEERDGIGASGRIAFAAEVNVRRRCRGRN